MTKNMKVQNIYAELPSSLNKELSEILSSSSAVTIERIISFGQSTPEGEWLEQESTEWVILLRGSADIHFYGNAEAVSLKVGDYLCIPPRTRHRVDRTDAYQPSVWLAVHY